jgi:predicted DNA binding protein
MSVVLVFSIESSRFGLGRVLSTDADVRLEIERIIPTGNEVMPFVWVSGEDHETFERTVRNRSAVKELFVLDQIDGDGLYRIEWADNPTDIIKGIAKTDATILEAVGDGDWVFQLRFPDHDHLAEFHEFCRDLDLPVRVERTYSFTEYSELQHRDNLSEPQREALVLALQRGYFATPRKVNLDELATELDITRQALSARIRRGNEKILNSVFRPAMESEDDWS